MRLAHLSDPHLLDLEGVSPWRLLGNKRLTGWLNLRLGRGHKHRARLVEAIVDELRSRAVEHIAVTGDLTNLALEREFERARACLEGLGRSPDDVSVVPGNHDVYTRGAQREGRFARYFDAYARSDRGLDRAVAHPSGRFPFLRVRGPALILGLSTAVARLPLFASGSAGAAQLRAVADALEDPALRDLTPVVLAHHPVLNPASPLRRALRGLDDAEALRTVLRARPEVLSLHGHLHRRGHRRVHQGEGTVHVLGATSASLVHPDQDRVAGYNLYELDERGRLARAWARVWEPVREDFVDRELPTLRDA